MTCSVKIQNIKSRPIVLQAGVPQGSILSPPSLHCILQRFSCYRCPPDEDQTLRRRHRRVDKPEKPRDRRQDPTGPSERYHHLDTHLENQAKPSQIPVHLNVLLPSQVPPPSPPSPTQQPGHPQTSTHPLPRRQPPVQNSRAHPWGRSENPVPHLQILHPSRHRIPRPHLRHPIPGPPPPNLHRMFRPPTGSPPTTSTRKPTQSRLKELQSRYVTRTLNSNNALAIQTQSTSFKYPSRDGRLLNRIPKIPKRKLKHPPTALLSPAYTDLQELVDSTPLTMR
jgi:hypothetical protein